MPCLPNQFLDLIGKHPPTTSPFLTLEIAEQHPPTQIPGLSSQLPYFAKRESLTSLTKMKMKPKKIIFILAPLIKPLAASSIVKTSCIIKLPGSVVWDCVEVKLRSAFILPWFYIFLIVVVSKNEENPLGEGEIEGPVWGLERSKLHGSPCCLGVRHLGPAISQAKSKPLVPSWSELCPSPQCICLSSNL